VSLAELLASWGYRLVDRGSVAIVECERTGCKHAFTFPRHELDPEPLPRVSWTLGLHAGQHLRPVGVRP